MNGRLQTQLFGPYFSSFSAHNYCYVLSNEPKSGLKLLGFASAPIHGQPPSFRPETALCPSSVSGWTLDTGGDYILPPFQNLNLQG